MTAPTIPHPDPAAIRETVRHIRAAALSRRHLEEGYLQAPRKAAP